MIIIQVHPQRTGYIVIYYKVGLEHDRHIQFENYAGYNILAYSMLSEEKLHVDKKYFRGDINLLPRLVKLQEL